MNFPLLNASTTNGTVDESNENAPNYALYAMYKDAGPCKALILPAVLMNVVAIPGIMCNLLLIFVTVKNKFEFDDWNLFRSLRGSTNFLLALTAMYEIMHQTTHFVFLFITVSGINFIPYFLALRLQILSIFGILAGQMCMVSIAADRLFAVIRTMSTTKPCAKYLAVHTLLSIIVGSWIAINAWRFGMRQPFLPVTGFISDLLVMDMEIIFVAIQILCALNVGLYVLVWVVVKIRSSPSSQKEPQEKLLKSLIVIIGIVIGGYVFNNVCRLVINHFFVLDQLTMWWIDVFGGIILNIGASAETPILYMCSSQYHCAINKELARLWCVCCCQLFKTAPNLPPIALLSPAPVTPANEAPKILFSQLCVNRVKPIYGNLCRKMIKI